MEPLRLMAEEDWRAILRAFSSQVRMAACLTDASGNLLFCHRERPPICQAIREDDGARSAVCGHVNASMLLELERKQWPVLGICDAGLVRLAVPVLGDNELVGQVTACGLASAEEEVDCFLISKLVGLSDEQVKQLALALPVGLSRELMFLGERLHRTLNPVDEPRAALGSGVGPIPR